MRKIDIQNFHRATRETSREVNRRIVLNLVRERGPVSRADLARSMRIPRGMVTSLVKQLIVEGLIVEGGTATAPRGRRPTLLHLRSDHRLTIAVDVTGGRTIVQLSDFAGEAIDRESFATPRSPGELVKAVAPRVTALMVRGRGHGTCEGVGVVVPGMVDERTGMVLNAPTLGWSDVDLRQDLARRLDVPVYVERDAVACALARIWLSDAMGDELNDFVYVIVSEGVGTGLVVNGQPVRGRHSSAGEFGHVPLDVNGPLCSCGGRGCLETFISDAATLARYLDHEFEGRRTTRAMRESGLRVSDLVKRARSGDRTARAAITVTGRYLGIGLASVINALNPARIIVGGEITAAWDLLEPLFRLEVQRRGLTSPALVTPIGYDADHNRTRLLGAGALVVGRAFAAPTIA